MKPKNPLTNFIKIKPLYIITGSQKFKNIKGIKEYTVFLFIKSAVIAKTETKTTVCATPISIEMHIIETIVWLKYMAAQLLMPKRQPKR